MQEYDTLDSIITIHKDCGVYISKQHRHKMYKSGTRFRVLSWYTDGECARVIAPDGLIGTICYRYYMS